MNGIISSVKNKIRNMACLLAVVTAGCGVVACHEEENLTIPIEPSYSDPEVGLAAFRQQLLAAPNGWEASLRPKNGKIYTLFMTLADAEVTLYADADTTAARTATRTGYTLALSQSINPSITFADGSNLARIPGGGKNAGVDQTYSYEYTRNDTVFLQGNQYGDQLRMVKASAEIRAAYEGRQLRNAMKAVTGYISTVHYLYLKPSEDVLIQFAVSTGSRGVYITYLQDGVKFFGTDYAYSLEGMHFKNPLRVAGNVLQDVAWEESTRELSVLYNGTRVVLQKATIPVIPLHYLLGTDYQPGAAAPSPVLQFLPGWSPKFRTLWMIDDEKAGDNEYYLYYVAPGLNIKTNTMELYVYYVSQNEYVAGKFQYTYTKTADGVFDFTFVGIDDTLEGDRARVIAPWIPNILTVLEDNRFRIEFFDAYEELGGVIPQFISVDDPDLYFTGLWFTP